MGKWAKAKGKATTPQIKSATVAPSSPGATKGSLKKWAKTSTKAPQVQKTASAKEPTLAHSYASNINAYAVTPATKKILSVYDTMHKSAAAFLKKYPLEEVEMGNGVIHIGGSASDKGTGCNGTYQPWSHRVRINANRFDSPKSYGKHWEPKSSWSVSSVAQSATEAAQRTLVHETAHHLHLGGPAREKVDRIIKQAYEDPKSSPITKYGSTCKNEYWTESFAAYHFHKADLKKHDPVGYKMVQDVLRKLRTA
jgi:hypothetical protein